MSLHKNGHGHGPVAAQQAQAPQPVAVVQILLLANGQIQASASGPAMNPHSLLGMLEAAKLDLYAKMREAQAKGPGIEVAPPDFLGR